jgi:hypothetical protein
MDLNNVLTQLHHERDALDAAILELESLERARRNRENMPQLVTKTASNGTAPVSGSPKSILEEL